LNLDVLIRNQTLDLRTGIITKKRDEHAVESLPIEFSWKDERTALCSWLWAFGRRFIVHAAARLRPRISRGDSGVVLASHVSITRLSGARTSEMNCEVENPSSAPRGSPR